MRPKLRHHPRDHPNQENHARNDKSDKSSPDDLAAMTTEFGAKLRMTAHPESACDGQLTIYRWAFDIAPSDISTLAVTVGRAYVTDAMRLAYPGARVSDKIPPEQGTTRKGDFGEMIAQGIYSTRMGPHRALQQAPTGQAGGQSHSAGAGQPLPDHHARHPVGEAFPNGPPGTRYPRRHRTQPRGPSASFRRLQRWSAAVAIGRRFAGTACGASGWGGCPDSR